MRDDASTDWVAVGEASRILKHSQEYTRRLADQGALRAIRLSNGHRIFRRADVEALARARAGKPAQ